MPSLPSTESGLTPHPVRTASSTASMTAWAWGLLATVATTMQSHTSLLPVTSMTATSWAFLESAASAAVRAISWGVLIGGSRPFL